MRLFKKYNTTITAIIKLVYGLLIIGLFFSKAIQSISIIILALGSLVIYDRQKIKSIFKDKLFISILFTVFIYLFSGIISSNLGYALQSVNGKILYLFVPFTFYLISINEKEKITGKFLFGFCSLLQAIYATYFFLADTKKTLQTYRVGSVLPVIKIQHVQIAVLIAITVLLLVSVMFDEVTKRVKWMALFMASLLFLFLHLFAVRSGIVLVYFMLVVYITLQLIKEKKWKLIGLSYFIMIGCMLSIYQFSSTLREKINYMQYDIQQYKTKSADAFNYSDSRRLKSIKNGIEILQKKPLFGCGVGDIEDECMLLYKKQNITFEKDIIFLPHSQYIYFLSCFGYILGTVLILCFIFPALYFFQAKEYLLFSIYTGLIVFASWDAFMGTLFGNCIFLLLIGLGFKKNN